MRAVPIALVLVAAAIAWLHSNPTGSATEPSAAGAFSLNVIGGECDDPAHPAACEVALEAAFTLVIQVDAAPPGGYFGFQTFLRYGTDHLTYNPRADDLLEIVWPACDPHTVVRLGELPAGLADGCLTGDDDPVPTTAYLGPVLELDFTCSEATGQSLVELLPIGDPIAQNNGTRILFEGGFSPPPPKVGSLVVSCRDPALITPRPTATPSATPSATTTATPSPTPTPTPARTPTPALLPGDANCDGSVSSIDAAIVLQRVAGLLASLPCAENADLNGDGAIDSRDAAIILQAVAGLIAR